MYNIGEKSVKLFVQLKAFGYKFFQVLIVGVIEEGEPSFISSVNNYRFQLTSTYNSQLQLNQVNFLL